MAAPHTLGRGAPSNRCGRLGLAPPQAARARAPLPHRAAKLAVASARRPYHAAATEHGPPSAVATSCDPLVVSFSGLPAFHLANGGSARGWLFNAMSKTAPIVAALLVAAGGLTNGGMIWYSPRRTLTGIAFAISRKEKIMRIITDEYREQLLKNRVYQMIVNTPKPDFTQLDKEVAEFEEWIAQEHKKEREARLAHGASAR